MVDELSKLVEIEPGQIVDRQDKYFPFTESATFIQLIYNTASASLDNQNYFAELPENVRNTLQTNLRSLISTYQEIINNKGNRNWMTSTYASMNERIKQIYNEIYDVFIRGMREYVNAQTLESTQKAAQAELERTREVANEEISKLKKATDEAVKTSGATQKTLKLAEEATSELSAVELSEFFDREVFRLKDDVPKIKTLPLWKRWTPIRNFWRQYVSAKGYEPTSSWWLVLTLIAITATSWIAYTELRGVNYSTITVNTVLAKALLLLAPAYAIRFCVRNYNASKHLATINKQRGVIMKTVIALFTRPGISESVREQALIAAVNQVFAPTETGYVTQRDGASGGDTVLDMSNLTSITKR